MGCNKIISILIIAIISDLAVAQTTNLPKWLTGTCNCTVDISNQEVTDTSNDCTHHFKPSSEVLVLPMHPGTGSPRVKAHCICNCELKI